MDATELSGRYHVLRGAGQAGRNRLTRPEAFSEQGIEQQQASKNQGCDHGAHSMTPKLSTRLCLSYALSTPLPLSGAGQLKPQISDDIAQQRRHAWVLAVPSPKTQHFHD